MCLCHYIESPYNPKPIVSRGIVLFSPGLSDLGDQQRLVLSIHSDPLGRMMWNIWITGPGVEGGHRRIGEEQEFVGEVGTKEDYLREIARHVIMSEKPMVDKTSPMNVLTLYRLTALCLVILES